MAGQTKTMNPLEAFHKKGSTWTLHEPIWAHWKSYLASYRLVILIARKVRTLELLHLDPALTQGNFIRIALFPLPGLARDGKS